MAVVRCEVVRYPFCCCMELYYLVYVFMCLVLFKKKRLSTSTHADKSLASFFYIAAVVWQKILYIHYYIDKAASRLARLLPVATNQATGKLYRYGHLAPKCTVHIPPSFSSPITTTQGSPSYRETISPMSM